MISGTGATACGSRPPLPGRITSPSDSTTRRGGWFLGQCYGSAVIYVDFDAAGEMNCSLVE